MKLRDLGTLALALATLTACGGSKGDDTPEPKTPPPPFELDRTWIYLGPSDVPHLLTVTDSAMVYTAVAGDWSSSWNLDAYDNGLHHFQVAFGAGTGTYLPVGQSMSGGYDLYGTVLTVQLAQGLTAYPPVQAAGTCTSATDGTPVPDCRLYIRQN